MIGPMGEGLPSGGFRRGAGDGLSGLSAPQGGVRELRERAAGASPGASGGSNSFSATLRAALDSVNRAQHEATVASHRLAAGMPVELHDVMIAAERAALTLELTVALQNKVVEAYREVTRMQV